MKELLSARGAAKRLHVSHVAVMKWVAVGKLKPFGKVESGTVVFEPAYIDQVAAERQQAAQDALTPLAS